MRLRSVVVVVGLMVSTLAFASRIPDERCGLQAAREAMADMAFRLTPAQLEKARIELESASFVTKTEMNGSPLLVFHVLVNANIPHSKLYRVSLWESSCRALAIQVIDQE